MPLSDDEFNKLLQKRLASTDGLEQDEDGAALSEEEKADLAIMREALGNYKAESLAWAEKRSATMPGPEPGALASLWDRTPRLALAGVAVTACAMAAVTLTHLPAHAPATVAHSPTAQVLAVDNQLLSSVDEALAGGASTPTAQELGLSATDLLTDAPDTQRHGRTNDATD